MGQLGRYFDRVVIAGRGPQLVKSHINPTLPPILPPYPSLCCRPNHTMGVMPQHRTNVNKHLSMQHLRVANILAFLETIINVCCSELDTSQMCCVGSSLEDSGQFTWLWIIIDWLRSIANQSIMVNITMSSASPRCGACKECDPPRRERGASTPGQMPRWWNMISGKNNLLHTMSMLWYLW